MHVSDGPVTESRVVVLPWDSFPTESTLLSDQLKRLFDVSLSIIAAFVCAPIILFFSLLIMAESPGCPIYRQKRIGKNGKEFFIYKLRTMRPGAAKLGFETQDNDNRVTRIGRILRVTKIDELPQILNILAGEMSIVGPRPLSTDECNYIENELGFARDYPGFYPSVQPGMIGLEQVNRTRTLSYAERFALNHEYECMASMPMDMHIFSKALKQCQQVCWLAFLTGMAEIVIASVQCCM
jgi:lipopolysaccharide/colanic/teichoic acid biosynthesis glycosyltransferase